MGVDLSIDFAGIHLKNPVLAASGTFGYGADMTDFFDPGLLGGIATKGISLLPRAGNPPVRIAETASGMLNAIGLNNVGLDAFIADKMPFLRSLDDTITVVNFYGNCIEDYVELTRRLSDVEGVDLLEMNISCPNVKEGGIAFGTDESMLREVVSACAAVRRVPLMVKLSPNVTDIVRMARIAENAGADALSLVNTFTGMAVDVQSRSYVLHNRIGGLSGPAIKPLALRMVHDVCRAVTIPVMGMGGILNAEDALEFLLVGARAVQVGTASFVCPTAMPEMIHGMETFLENRGVASVGDWIGSLAT